jgi:hypothetical protein
MYIHTVYVLGCVFEFVPCHISRACIQLKLYGYPSQACLPRRFPMATKSSLFLSLGRWNSCGFDCPCACHIRSHKHRSWRLPSFIQKTVGPLSVSYTGYSVPTACDSGNCAKDRRTRLALNFAFLRYAIYGVLEASLAGPLSLGLVACQRCPLYAIPDNILWAAKIGDGNAVRNILRENGSAVLTVHCEDGESALYYAVIHAHYHPRWRAALDILLALFQAGADPDLPNDNGITFRQWIAHNQLIGTFERLPDILPAMSRFLPSQAGIESLELTFLHEIVLGLCNANLAAVLHSKDPRVTSLLNVGDAIGMPLLIHINLLCPDQEIQQASLHLCMP